MKIASNTSRTERTILGVSVALMLLALFLFVNEKWYSKLTGNSDLESQFTSLGRVNLSENDVRYKEGHRFDWQRSKEDQSLFIGDSVFVGPKSQAQVRLNGKNDLHLGENSLVKFSNYNGKTLSDLLAGNFRLQIDGQVQIAINGQVTTLKGNGSEVQVFFDKKNQPKMKLLKGAVTVTQEPPTKKVAKVRKKMIEPTYETGRSKEKTLAAANEELALEATTPEATYHFPPEPFSDSKLVQYNWKIRDVYEQVVSRWRLRKTRPQKADLSQTFAWSDATEGPYQIAYGSVENFDSRMTNVTTVSAKSFTAPNLYLGDNYWRVSRDGIEWSTGVHFVVVPTFRSPAPVFTREELKVDLVNGQSYGSKIEWTAAPDETGFLVEASAFEDFSEESTQIYWRREPNFPSGFKSAGTYYFRVRGANAQQELTETSKILKVVVEEPGLLGQPLLPLAQLKFVKGKESRVSWKGATGAQSYSVRILSHKGTLLRETTSIQSQLDVGDLPIGLFSYQVVAKDRFGRLTEPSRLKNFSIEPPPPSQPPPSKRVLASNTLPPQAPSPTPEPTPPAVDADAELISTQVERAAVVAKLSPQAPTSASSLPYRRSLIQVEGASLGVTSSEQLTFGTAAPLLGTLGLRGQHWKERFGAEASVKVKAFGYNAEADKVAPVQLEVRAHHRWTLPIRWFSFLKEIQASIFGGAEVYRNASGAKLYSAGYELIKGGVALKFPVGSSWESGGELAYGLGLESSRKYEASGYLSHLFKKDWSFGVGYRVHYFEAGSSKATPFVLPYREAQGEAFSVLRYSY
jgi:hypothetical protein